MSLSQIDFEIDLIITSRQSFSEIAYAIGLDPASDFQNMDLRGIDFGISDLRDFRFHGSRLDQSNLSRSKISAATLAGVSSSKGTIFPQGIETFSLRPRTITTHLPPYAFPALRDRFGSIRGATLATIVAAQRLDEGEIRMLIEEIVDRNMLTRSRDFRAVGNKIPEFSYVQANAMAALLNIPLTVLIRALLLLSTPDFISAHSLSKLARPPLLKYLRTLKVIAPWAEEQYDLL